MTVFLVNDGISSLRILDVIILVCEFLSGYAAFFCQYSTDGEMC